MKLSNLGYDLLGLNALSCAISGDAGKGGFCGASCQGGCTPGCTNGCDPGCTSCHPGCGNGGYPIDLIKREAK